MKKLSFIFLALFLVACSAKSTAASTATLTLAPTFTPAPTLTSTSTPDTVTLDTVTPDTVTPDTVTPDTETLPPIETVPFNEKTYKILSQLDVEAWEAAAGRALTPKDIIDASKLGDVTPFPSDALVTGFYPFTNADGSIEMKPIVDKKVGADKLPMTYEAVMLEKIKDKIPKDILKIAEKEGVGVDKLLAVIWRVNTPSGELIGIMITDGYTLDGTQKRPNLSQDFLEGTGVVAGKDDWTMTPMVKMPTVKGRADVMGSEIAKSMAANERIMQQKIQEVMAGADLTDKEDLAEVQELLDENWLFMGGTTDKTVKVK